VRRFEFIPDSGGDGKHRGGCGVRKDIELLNSCATLSLLGDRHKYQPYGLQGGAPGHVGETILNPHLNAEPLGSKEIRDLKKGDVVSIRLSGAGGYGDPKERSTAAREADLIDGYISSNNYS
jgi:N-methylhydantoinase B